MYYNIDKYLLTKTLHSMMYFSNEVYRNDIIYRIKTPKYSIQLKETRNSNESFETERQNLNFVCNPISMSMNIDKNNVTLEIHNWLCVWT